MYTNKPSSAFFFLVHYTEAALLLSTFVMLCILTRSTRKCTKTARSWLLQSHMKRWHDPGNRKQKRKEHPATSNLSLLSQKRLISVPTSFISRFMAMNVLRKMGTCNSTAVLTCQDVLKHLESKCSLSLYSSFASGKSNDSPGPQIFCRTTQRRTLSHMHIFSFSV